ncbi:leucine aminopeptidase family protein [Salix suchowensis]|nr:leucine aminopeptidase family protein [Salix suchowensis]
MTKDDNKRFENSLLKNLDAKLGGHLSEASSDEDFTGKPSQSLVLRSATNVYAFCNFGEAIAAAAKNAQASDVGIVLTSTRSTSKESKLNIASTIASGIVLGTYEDNRCSSAVIFGKELLNSPANVLTPVVLAEEATKIASTYNDVFSATILNAEQCKS